MLAFVIFFTAVADPGEALVVYVTAPEAEAPALARALVERRVAACVNLVPALRSFYWWKDEIQDDAEVLLIAKTTAVGFEALRAAVVELHSYEVPEVVALPIVAAHTPYQTWLVEQVGGPRS